MKLPFNSIIAPLMKKYFNTTNIFCSHPTFTISLPYTYFYSSLGLLISINHLITHMGEEPSPALVTIETITDLEQDFMLVHDLKIIATSMGCMQYCCLLAGCYTENPALFLPHLAGQIIVMAVKFINILYLMTSNKGKSWAKLKHRIPAILLMAFNWLQEFCVFRQYLCVCDL